MHCSASADNIHNEYLGSSSDSHVASKRREVRTSHAPEAKARNKGRHTRCPQVEHCQPGGRGASNLMRLRSCSFTDSHPSGERIWEIGVGLPGIGSRLEEVVPKGSTIEEDEKDVGPELLSDALV
jgi:hypothetical protein